MEWGREVRKGIAAKNLCILLYSYSLYYWGLNIHVCVMFSFLFSFILYSCLYVNVYITLCLFYTLLFLFYFNFFLILWYFLNFEMLCFVFISVLLTSCIFIAKSYFNMKYLFNKPSINKQHAWHRIRVAWIKCCIMTLGGTTIASIAAPVKQPSLPIVRN